MELTNDQYEKLKKDVVNSLVWKGVAGLLGVLALTIAVAIPISGKDGKDGSSVSQEQVDFSVKKLLDTDPNDFPSGAIVAWAFKDKPIPSGWEICNGDSGTPDLRDLFLRGVGVLKETGLNEKSSDSHNHSGNVYGSGSAKVASTSQGSDDITQLFHDHVHPLSISPTSNVPRHYKVVYLMKL